MDASQLAGGNIPPQALAALQQQQSGGMDITAILAQLSQMSPDEVSAALQQLGINVPPAQLAAAAEQWVENAAGKQASGGTDEATAADGESDGEATPAQAPSAPSAPTDEEAPADDDMEEGEAVPSGPSGSPGGGMPSGAGVPRGGGGAMPKMSGGGNNMDALISAAMSQGDPDSMPSPIRGPGAGGAPSMRGPAMPGAGAPSPAAGNDPRMRAMLQSIYRQAGGDAQRGVPRGSGGAAIPSGNPRAGRKRNV